MLSKWACFDPLSCTRVGDWMGYRFHLWSVDFPELRLCLQCGMTLVPGVGALTLGECGWKNGSSPSFPQAQCGGSQLWTANWTHLQLQHCRLHSQKSACYHSCTPRDHTEAGCVPNFGMYVRKGCRIERMKEEEDALNTFRQQKGYTGIQWNWASWTWVFWKYCICIIYISILNLSRHSVTGDNTGWHRIEG